MHTDAPNERLVWIDLEMTGLDTQRDGILEIATVVTDARLNVLAASVALWRAVSLAVKSFDKELDPDLARRG